MSLLNTPIEVPTDNLYKFMAISGIVIFILSFYPFYHIHNLHIEIIRTEGDIKKLKVRSVMIHDEVKELGEDFDHMKKLLNVGIVQKNNTTSKPVAPKQPLSMDQICREYQELLKMKPLLFGKVMGLELDAIDVKTKSDEQEVIFKEIEREKYIFVFGTPFGGFLSLWGFILWYKKIQIHQDLLIKMHKP